MMGFTWYDKLALAGLLVGLIGFVMFWTGLNFAIDASRQTRANFMTSLDEAVPDWEAKLQRGESVTVYLKPD